MFLKLTAACLAVAAAISTPALANETAIGVAASSRAADVSVADAEFEDLFESWEDLEEGGLVNASGEIIAAPRIGVSVPSRNPLDTARLSSNFGMRNHPVLGGRRAHHGVDLAAPHGTPVYATADGLVGMAQWYSSYGNYVQIEHGGSLQTRYAHLSSYTVQPGDMVQKGDLIGYVGSTGRSTGPHLHYEVRVEGQPVNPVPYMLADAVPVADATAGQGGPE